MSALEKAKHAWASNLDHRSQADVDESVRGVVALIRGIAQNRSLSVDQYSRLMKFDIETAGEVFDELSGRGFQTDETGSIVGAFVTTIETSVKIHAMEKDLYAWSALFSLFISGILASTTEIESVCPVTGETIRIAVSGRRVTSIEPGEVWLSAFLPSDFSREIGPESPACRQSHFFYDQRAADEWVKARDTVVALSLDDGFELAQMVGPDLARRAKR